MTPEPLTSFESVAPLYRLYSVNQITVAAFLGTPLAGFWLASRNFDALGRKKESKRSLIWGIGLTLGAVLIGVLVPENFPALAVSIPFVIATSYMAKQWFRHDLNAHVSAGGRLGSWWICVLVAVVALVVLFLVLFAVALVLRIGV